MKISRSMLTMYKQITIKTLGKLRAFRQPQRVLDFELVEKSGLVDEVRNYYLENPHDIPPLYLKEYVSTFIV